MTRTSKVKKLRRTLKKEAKPSQRRGVERRVRTRAKSYAGDKHFVIGEKPARRGTK